MLVRGWKENGIYQTILKWIQFIFCYVWFCFFFSFFLELKIWDKLWLDIEFFFLADLICGRFGNTIDLVECLCRFSASFYESGFCFLSMIDFIVFTFISEHGSCGIQTIVGFLKYFCFVIPESLLRFSSEIRTTLYISLKIYIFNLCMKKFAQYIFAVLRYNFFFIFRKRIS